MTALAPPSAAPAEPCESDGHTSRLPRLALGAICLLSAVLYGWSLWGSGWGNEYYSAAVKSMSQSVQNFLFGAFDPAGVLTVDKPPMALWPQVVSTWIFGFHNWSVLLPQAVAGVATVFLLQRTVRRWAGEPAALIAALLLALTPVVVAINQINNPDTLLVLLLVAAAYAFTRSIQAARPRSVTLWLVLAAALIGCGFVTKMMQAWIVLPVFAAAYLVGSGARWPRRLLDLLAAAGAAAAASLWWVALVDWWPGEKPYIGGSEDGSAWDLVVGYNGFGRIFGEGSRGGPSGGSGGGFAPPRGAVPEFDVPGGPYTIVGGPGVGGPGVGGPGVGGFGGQSGIDRMFNDVVGGQISWLLPLSLLCLVVGVVFLARRQASAGAADLTPLATGRATNAGWVLWGGWLVLTGLVFSYAEGIWHPYYTTMLAPAIGALCGAGLVLLWRLYRAPTGLSWLLLPGAVVLTAVWAWVLVSRDTSWQGWVRYAVVVVAAVAVVALVAGRRTPAGSRWQRFAAVAGLVAVTLAPGVWAVVTAVDGAGGGANVMAGPNSGTGFPGMRIVSGGPAYGSANGPGGQGGQRSPSSGQPGQQPPTSGQPGGQPPPSGQPGQRQPGQDGYGGPGLVTVGGPPGGFGRAVELSAQQRAILDYVLREAPGMEITLVVQGGSHAAAGYIINTDYTVVGIGGFSGGDPAPTAEQLARWVAEGRARFVVGGGGRMGGFGGSGSGAGEWITNNCVAVDPARYGGTSTQDQQAGPGGGTLMDCASR